jgi:hypothetical protein
LIDERGVKVGHQRAGVRNVFGDLYARDVGYRPPKLPAAVINQVKVVD